MSPGTYFLGASVLILAVFIQLDPLKFSPIRGINFLPCNYSELEAPVHLESVNSSRIQNAQQIFAAEIFGAESIAFDGDGGGPYTGLGDGRIVKLNPETKEIQMFAYTSPRRSTNCTLPKAGPNLAAEHICGRPLGLRFHGGTGELFIADAYLGLHKVGKEGGQATMLTSMADGVPFRFTNDLDFDGEGNVLFTDSSSKYQRRQFFLEVLEGGAHGRLLKYNVGTGATEVLLRGLRFPNGVAVSKDRDFLLFTETSLMRVQKYWLRGPRAGESEVVAQMPGWPDNVRLNPQGNFWVGVHARRNWAFDLLAPRPWIRTLMLRMPVSIRFWYVLLVGLPHGVAVELDGEGKLLRVLKDSSGKAVRAVSEVEEHGGRLWFGSVIMSYIGVCHVSDADLVLEM